MSEKQSIAAPYKSFMISYAVIYQPLLLRPDFNVVEMGYIEAGHGVKGRKVWLFDDVNLRQMYECNKSKKNILLWCYSGKTLQKKGQNHPSSNNDKEASSTGS